MKSFNKFRFDGLNPRDCSNKYYRLNRVSENKDKIVVRFSSEHLFETPYGYGFIVGNHHIVWVKRWQVERNYFTEQYDAYEILLNKEFYKIHERPDEFSHLFVDGKGFYRWNDMVEIASYQEDCKWSK